MKVLPEGFPLAPKVFDPRVSEPTNYCFVKPRPTLDPKIAWFTKSPEGQSACNFGLTQASWVQLILLSRINGDAPAHKTISAGRLDGSRAGSLLNFGSRSI
jgi:hypothetical protein